MKICQTTRAHLALLSIKPTQSTQIHPFNVKLYFGFLLFVLSIILCCLFVIFEANSFLEYIQSFCMTTAVATVGLCFTAVVSQKSQLFKFIKSIEKIINIRLRNPASKIIHEATDRKVEKISRYLDIGMGRVMPQFITWSKYVGCFVIYFTTDLAGDAFELPLPFWFPFEWRNPIGYTVAVSLQCIVITYTFFTMMTMLVIGIASYSFGISLTEDLKYILHSIEEKSKLRKNRPYLYRQFIEFIILQSDTMQTMGIISKLLQPVFLIIFSRDLIALSIAMLLVQLELTHRADFGMALFVLVYDAVNSFAIMFICCELSQRLSNAFNDINVMIKQSKWYLFPIELKRILPTVMIVTQEPFVLECFGGISCCREVFQKIMNVALSYYMVLRRLIK